MLPGEEEIFQRQGCGSNSVGRIPLCYFLVGFNGSVGSQRRHCEYLPGTENGSQSFLCNDEGGGERKPINLRHMHLNSELWLSIMCKLSTVSIYLTASRNSLYFSGAKWEREAFFF